MIAFEDYTIVYGDSKLVLRPFALEATPEHPDILGAQLRVDVIENVNFPAEVFIWERFMHMEDDSSSVVQNRVVCVAKPSDLSVYPVGNPDGTRTDIPPFFRETWFEMTIDSPDVMLETWSSIKSDCAGLVSSVVQLGGV